MDPSIDLKTILDLHQKWLRSESGGNRANLSLAYLSGADLSGANLSLAYLSGATGAELAFAMASHLPEGDIIGWKKCRDGVLVKLLIPAKAARSHASSRKCRAQFAKVLEVIGAKVGLSLNDGKTEYKKGQMVYPHEWCEDRWEECAGGIHFFITRLEAEAFTL